MQDLVNDLLNTGLTEKELGDLVGLSQAQIHRLKTGESKDTSYTAGTKLHDLHQVRCSQPTGAGKA